MTRANPATTSSANDQKISVGDPIPPKSSVIEIHVREQKQLFNSIDPSPFRNKDLEPDAEKFTVGWAKDPPRDVALQGNANFILDNLIAAKSCEPMIVVMAYAYANAPVRRLLICSQRDLGHLKCLRPCRRWPRPSKMM